MGVPIIVHQVVEAEKVRGAGGGDSEASRKFAVQIANLEMDLHAERNAHIRDNDAQQNHIKVCPIQSSGIPFDLLMVHLL